MDTRRVLGAMRVAVGLKFWLAPALSTKVFGLGGVGVDGRVAFLVRLGGVRDFVLGGAVLAAEDPEAVRRALQLGLVVDMVDVVAAVVAVRRGMSVRGLVLAGGGAAVLAGLGAAALLALEEPALDAPGLDAAETSGFNA